MAVSWYIVASMEIEKCPMPETGAPSECKTELNIAFLTSEFFLFV